MRAHGDIAPNVLAELEAFAAGHETTEAVFRSLDARRLRDYEILAQDEYSIDIVVAMPGGAWLVYDTT